MVTDITRITHTHDGALHGAVLQCYAVYLALKTSKLNVNEYLDELKNKMKVLEGKSAYQKSLCLKHYINPCPNKKFYSFSNKKSLQTTVLNLMKKRESSPEG